MLGYSLFLFVNYLPAPTCNSQAAKLYDQALSSNRAETIMLNTPEESLTHAQLRQRAELRLRGGIAPPTQGWTIGAASLSLLHRLASDPATAADALKLLHELQVHQVELDLQHEHMDEERQAQEQSARRLAELYLLAPFAYFMVTCAGQIIEGNLVGARLLGVDRDDVTHHNISCLVMPGSRASLTALFQQVCSSGLRHSCRVQPNQSAQSTQSAQPGWSAQVASEPGHKRLEVVASASPDGLHCLVAVVDVSDFCAAGPPA